MSTENTRIIYIDFIKAFAIFLVVLGHIPQHCLGHDTCGLVRFINHFHMPLFFMISGYFVNTEKLRRLCLKDAGGYLWDKTVKLIIPTLSIMLVYCLWKDINIAETIFHDKWRAGYWFTFTLWEFFVITLIGCILIKNNIESLLLSAGLVLAIVFGTNWMNLLFKKIDYIDIINNAQLKFFFFFALGIFIRKHTEKVVTIIKNKVFLSILLLSTYLYALFSDYIPTNIISIKLNFLIFGIVGCITSYAYFKKHEDLYCENKWWIRITTLIGRRTLDIYLLHYFFLPTNLQVIGEVFAEYHNPSIEIVCTLLISMVVITLSLLAGSILRLTGLFVEK